MQNECVVLFCCTCRCCAFTRKHSSLSSKLGFDPSTRLMLIMAITDPKNSVCKPIGSRTFGPLQMGHSRSLKPQFAGNAIWPMTAAQASEIWSPLPFKQE